jgi:hypothetical protein
VKFGSYDRIDLRGSYDIALVPDKFTRASRRRRSRADGYFDILDYECVNAPAALAAAEPVSCPGATHTTFGIPLPLPPTAPVDLHSPLARRTSAQRMAVSSITSATRTSRRGAPRIRALATEQGEFNFIADITEMDQRAPSDKYTYLKPVVQLQFSSSATA